MSVTAQASFTAYMVSPSVTVTSVASMPSESVTACPDDLPDAVYGFHETGCGTSDAPFNSITYAALEACCPVHLMPYVVPLSESMKNHNGSDYVGEMTVGAYCPIGASAVSLSNAFMQYVSCVQGNSPCTKIICGAVLENDEMPSKAVSNASPVSVSGQGTPSWRLLLAFTIIQGISFANAAF